MPQFTGIWSLTEAQGAVRNQNWPGIAPPSIEYLVVAGGGGSGGSYGGGAGGSGGLLAGFSGVTAGTQLWVTVGAGGSSGSGVTDGGTGNNSVLLATSSGASTGNIVANGGGAIDLEIQVLDTKRGPMLIVYLLVNVCDAMGSNIVNTMVEGIAPFLEDLTGGYARLRVVSNYAVRRVVKATAIWKKEIIGAEVVEGVLDADALAFADPYRAATHNKGIMNGVDAVVIATGNDFRAVEAGAHSYAARNGLYQPLSTYYKNEEGDLVGELEMPLAIGIVGGITKSHPIAQLCLKILRVKSAQQLAEIIGAVGLAQNFAALRVLVREGLQRGHMRLHSKNMAGNVGAVGEEIDAIADRMVSEHCISAGRARELFEELKK